MIRPSGPRLVANDVLGEYINGLARVLFHDCLFVLIGNLDSFTIKVLISQGKLLHDHLLHLLANLVLSLLTPPVQASRGGIIKGIVNKIAPILNILGLHSQGNPFLIKSLLHRPRLHEKPPQIPATRPQFLDSGGFALEQVILQAALFLNSLEHAHGQTSLDLDANGRGEKLLDEDIGTPETGGFDAVLFRDIIAETDAHIAV